MTMKTFLFRLVPVFIGAFLFQTAFSQQLDSIMGLYETQLPREKIHIHFDKTIYNKDETIWYKLYLMSGTDLSTISKNIYVEWYDTSGRMLKQTVAPLYQSTAKGSFELPTAYAGDFIRVKAYTRWMLNDDTSFFYQKDIQLNSPPVVGQAKKIVVYKTRVDAFPEGGELIQGLSTRIAFKATNQFGFPVFIKGAVYTDKNKFVDTLIVKHDGMGSFNLMAQEGETYHLNWIDESGKKGTTPLQPAKSDGASITIKTTNEKALVQIQRTSGVPDNYKRLSLWVHMNQSLYYKVSINATEKTSINAQIPIDELPTGVLQFTLFTSDWKPIAERIIFVNNRQHEFNAKVTFPLVGTDRRARNVVDVFVSDTAYTNMSLSVVDATVGQNEPNSIYSDFLLSNDIRGKVFNPAYYLTSDADSITANLDLVMLTNGWRRFDWEKAKAGILPVIQYPRETDFLKVAGKVYAPKATLNTGNLQLNFIVIGKDSVKHLMFAPVSRDGSFEIKNMFFYDTVRVYYNFNGNNKLTDVSQVQIENGLLRQAAKKSQFSERNPLGNWNDSLARAKMNFILSEEEKLRKSMASATLQEVVVKAKAKTNVQLLDERYASGLFSGGDGYQFDLEQDSRNLGLDILGYLQGKVAGLMITGTGAQATLSWRGATPDIFLNESQASVDIVQSIALSDIAYVKIFRPPFFGSVGGGSGGAIAIYTKKGTDTRKADPNAKGLENTILGGYSRFKEFFNPQYEKPSEINNPDPDLRSTLYWNPYVLTNKKSPKIRLTFFNNDISKKFLLVLEGVNGDGKMTRVVKLVDSSVQD